MDSAPPTRTHARACAQAEEWSPQRAAATRRLTRKRSRKKPRLRHEPRAAGTRANTVRTDDPLALGGHVRGPFFSLFASFALFDGAAAHAAQEREGQKRRRSERSQQRSIRFPSLRFLFHFSRVIYVHALRRKKRGVYRERDTRLQMTERRSLISDQLD